MTKAESEQAFKITVHKYLMMMFYLKENRHPDAKEQQMLIDVGVLPLHEKYWEELTRIRESNAKNL